jgi:hypothetical protein
MTMWIDRVQDPATVACDRMGDDQPRVLEEAELPRDGRSADGEVRGKTRWTPRPRGQRRDDLPPGRVGKQSDPAAASKWHPPRMPEGAYLSVNAGPRPS